jgi:hypothetical protein
MREKVEAILANVRPALQADGGDVELVEIDDQGIVESEVERCLRRLPHGLDDAEKRYRKGS